MPDFVVSETQPQSASRGIQRSLCPLTTPSTTPHATAAIGEGTPSQDIGVSLVGKYFRKNRSDFGKNADDYFDFRADGTFSCDIAGKTYHGTYEVKGDPVKTKFQLIRSDTFRIVGDTIVTPKGGIWEKQVAP